MAEVRELSVDGRYESIPAVVAFVAKAAEAAGLDGDATFHCSMAVDEACTNIIEHAYGGQDGGVIEITCTIEPGVCTIRIVDYGQPFDPAAVPMPQAGQSLDQIRPGGIGLHLMRKMMDQVEFQFTEGRNILTMIKKQTVPPLTKLPLDVPVAEIGSQIWLVSPQGRLDAASVGELETTLGQLMDQGRLWLIVDMSEVPYISSRGLKTLVSAWRRVGDSGGNLSLFGLTPRVSEVFDTVGFTHIFDIYSTREEALAAAADRTG